MPILRRDGIEFFFQQKGNGLPFIFQHGLGGSVEQPFGLFEPPAGIRMIAMDCRGHGRTQPLGDPQRISLASFANDLAALLDDLQIEQAVVGGISMGAAITLNFTLRFPHRVLGLVQSRPAWLSEPNPRNAQWFSEIARLIRQHGVQEGRSRFEQSDLYRQMRDESPDVAQSLLNQFDNPRAECTVALLEQLRGDKPCASLDQLAQIRIPSLVMANRQDPVHPFEYGEAVAAAIPGSQFHELTAKSVSVERHQQDLQKCLERFLRENFLGQDQR